MDRSSRGHERAHLERELATESGKALLRKLKRREADAGGFGSWGELLEFMHGGASEDPRKDRILCAIALARKEDEHPLWSSALLLIFWPGLLTLFKKRLSWDRNSDDLWQVVVTEFLQAVVRLDVTRRSERIASKLVNDTYSRTYRAYQPRWRQQERERPFDPTQREPEAPEGIDLEAVTLREAQELEVARYREAFAGGVVSEDDFLLLVATCVYGQSVADYARDQGCSYEALRKRRQRALSAVAAWRKPQ